MRFTYFSKLIRSKREKAGLSQIELAKALGYETAQLISNVERGICAFPLMKWKRVSKTLDLSLTAMKRLYLKDVAIQIDQKVR